VLFDPSGTATGTTTMTLHDVPADVTGTIAFNTATVVTTTVAGQNARYTFTGVAGQRVALNQSGYNCFTAHTGILKPDGTELVGTCGGSFIDATVLLVGARHSRDFRSRPCWTVGDDAGMCHGRTCHCGGHLG
jgi:hypothetical protein